MRLLKARSEELVEFLGEDVPPYAILSHTWSNEEVTLECLTSGQYRKKAGYRKIRYTLDQAIKDKLEWAWIDTCCIDKSSSAELSEAINSMFRWYASAEICYAYLEDKYIYRGLYQVVSSELISAWALHDSKSQWFTRGWTLQELLAPQAVRFYGRRWDFIADRRDSSEELKNITGIPVELLARRVPLTQTALLKYSVAEKMYWASKRVTTRPEDRAYSLLGLFGVNMPLLYGEGINASFRRLQEEILRVRADLSILAWFGKSERAELGQGTDLLARSPDEFQKCGNLILTNSATNSIMAGEATLSNVALRVSAPVVKGPAGLFMVLPVRLRDDFTRVLALKLTFPLVNGELVEDVQQKAIECIPVGGDDRLAWIDAQSAISEAEEKSIAIGKDASRARKYLPTINEYRPCDHLWLRCSKALADRLPQLTFLSPQRCWATHNWTCNLREARREFSRKPDDLRDIFRIRAAMLLQRPPVWVAIYLRELPSEGEEEHDKFECSLAWYTEQERRSYSEFVSMPEQLLSSLELNDQETIIVRLHVREIFEHRVAIIDIDLIDKAASQGEARFVENPKSHYRYRTLYQDNYHVA